MTPHDDLSLGVAGSGSVLTGWLQKVGTLAAMMFAFAFTEFHPAALAPTDFASARQAGSVASLHLTSCANWQAGDHNTS
ncbi:MAG: hypothetical protein ACRC8D_02745 [Aeromonas sp.]